MSSSFSERNRIAKNSRRSSDFCLWLLLLFRSSVVSRSSFNHHSNRAPTVTMNTILSRAAPTLLPRYVQTTLCHRLELIAASPFCRRPSLLTNLRMGSLFKRVFCSTYKFRLYERICIRFCRKMNFSYFNLFYL
jgi:hypothetical protein